MTADAKVGLLLGLLFIVVIAFLLNGPAGFLKADKPVVQTEVPALSGKNIVIDQAVAEVARELNSPPLRETDPPEEVRVLEDFSTPARAVVEQTPRTSVPVRPAVPVGRTHTVKPGENLAVIAIRYYGQEQGNKLATVNKLFEINRDVLDSPDTVRVGDQLKIPGFEQLFTPVPGRRVPVERGFLNRLSEMFDSAPAFASSSSRRFREYVVQNGDRLWDIAEEQMGDGKRYKELVKLNRIADPDHVPAGVKLKIPIR